MKIRTIAVFSVLFFLFAMLVAYSFVHQPEVASLFFAVAALLFGASRIPKKVPEFVKDAIDKVESEAKEVLANERAKIDLAASAAVVSADDAAAGQQGKLAGERSESVAANGAGFSQAVRDRSGEAISGLFDGQGIDPPAEGSGGGAGPKA